MSNPTLPLVGTQITTSTGTQFAAAAVLTASPSNNRPSAAGAKDYQVTLTCQPEDGDAFDTFGDVTVMEGSRLLWGSMTDTDATLYTEIRAWGIADQRAAFAVILAACAEVAS